MRADRLHYDCCGQNEDLEQRAQSKRIYEQIDHQVMEWQSSTGQDARTLARLLLQDEACEWTPMLHAASGRDERRFDPAFNALLNLIPDERVSGEVQPDYPARSASLLPEDRAVLRSTTESTNERTGKH